MSGSNGYGLVIEAERSTDTLHRLVAKLGGQTIFVTRIDISKPTARSQFVEKICEERPGIASVDVERQLLELAAAPSAEPPTRSAPTPQALLAEMPESVRAEALAMLQGHDLLARVLVDIEALGVAGECELGATTYLIGTSRLLERPLAGIFQGPTSSGKSFTAERVASMFPNEAVIIATSITPQALFFMEPGALSHKFVVAGERSRVQDDETAEGTRALREMLASGKLSKLLPVKVNGRMQTEHIIQSGPIAYIETTSMTSVFAEDANRCIQCVTDERREQTRLVVQMTAENYAGNASNNSSAVIERHHAIQRMLQSLPVIIPFACAIAKRFPDSRVEARRAFGHLMSMIQACALLHQFQRQRDSEGRIVAERFDYETAHWLLSEPLARQLGGSMSAQARRLHERLLSAYSIDGTFTVNHAALLVNHSDTSVRGWISELQNTGHAEMFEESRGRRPAVWRLTPGRSPTTVLPSPDEVFGGAGHSSV